MDFRADHFALFGLTGASGSICRTSIPATATFRRRFIRIVSPMPARPSVGISMQWATHANEAYQTLKKPLERAKYMLHLAGHDIQAETNTAMPADFLMEQMEWREAVVEARNGGDHHELEHLHNRLRGDINGRYVELGESAR